VTKDFPQITQNDADRIPLEKSAWICVICGLNPIALDENPGGQNRKWWSV